MNVVGAHQTTGSPQKKTLHQLLRSLELEQYAGKLAEDGLRTMQELRVLEDEDLRLLASNAKMNIVERRRFLRAALPLTDEKDTRIKSLETQVNSLKSEMKSIVQKEMASLMSEARAGEERRKVAPTPAIGHAPRPAPVKIAASSKDKKNNIKSHKRQSAAVKIAKPGSSAEEQQKVLGQPAESFPDDPRFGVGRRRTPAGSVDKYGPEGQADLEIGMEQKTQEGEEETTKVEVLVPTVEEVKEYAETSNYKTARTDEGREAMDKQIQEVTEYLCTKGAFETMLVPTEYITPEFVELFLKKMWINRSHYTLNGKVMFKGSELKTLCKNPIDFLKELDKRVLKKYHKMVRDFVDGMDIYMLPSLKMQIMDLGALTNLVNIDEKLMSAGKGMMNGGSMLGSSMLNASGIQGGAKQKSAIASLDPNSGDWDQQVEKVFNEMDGDKSGEVDFCEFTRACLVLQKEGVAMDESDALAVEECQAMFDLIDEDGSGEIDLEEFKAFVSKATKNESLIKGTSYSVWNDNTTYLFAYLYFAMSFILQFMVPMAVFNLYKNGKLGNMPEMCEKYPLSYMCEPSENPNDPITMTLYQLAQREGMGAMLCPRLAMSSITYGRPWPQTSMWAPTTDASDGILPRLSSVFLFLYLMVSTEVTDKIDASLGDMPDEYDMLQHSYMTQDTFFYKTSYIINLWCYNFIVLTTYMLFIASPTASDLLLNVIALQFLIDVDDHGYDAIVDEADKEDLVAKMVLCYIQNGEKSQNETERDRGGCGPLKYIGYIFCGPASAYLAVGLYYIDWLMPPFLALCMV